MKVVSSLLTVFCLGIFLSGTATAHADTFAFTATGDFTGIGSGSGTLTAVADANIANAFDVTGISGSVGGVAITGLLACAAYDPSNPCSSPGSGGFFYDNLLYPSGVPPLGILALDFQGIGFELADGAEARYYASSSHQTSFVTNSPHDNGHVAGFSIGSIPEPGSFFLFGTGLLGMAGAVRRRIKN